MNLSKKAKSNLIFYGIAATLLLFLFATSWGSSFRAWMMSFTLRTPDVTTSEVVDKSAQVIGLDWMIIDDNGNELWISEIDQPIFVNIWATWCGPCRSEMGSIMDLQAKMGDKISFLLVSPSEGQAIVAKYKTEKGITFPLYTNGSITPQNLYSTVFPTTFIIDKNKVIVYKWEGAYNWDNDKIIALLEKLAQANN